LDDERKGLQNELSKAVAELKRQKLRVENEIRKNDEILFNSYNEKIDEALMFFKDKLDELRKPGKIDKRTRGGETNLITMKKEFQTETNVDAIRKAMTYCQAVIRELEEMRLNPGLDLLRIETLKKNIPSIDIYQETIGERTRRGAEDVNPKLMRK
jgi:folate-binding Fe-S cluster repair protein YgfZ